MPVVVSSILIEKQCALISALNLARSSFSETCHLIFEAVSLRKLPEPPDCRLLPNFLTCSWNFAMHFRHCSAHCLTVAVNAFNWAVCSQDLISASTSSNAWSRLHNSRITAWYSAEEPRLLSRDLTRSLMRRESEIMSPTEPKVIGIVSRREVVVEVFISHLREWSRHKAARLQPSNGVLVFSSVRTLTRTGSSGRNKIYRYIIGLSQRWVSNI